MVSLQEELRDKSSKNAIFRWDFSYYKRMAKDCGFKLDSDKVSQYFSFQLVLPKLFQVFSLLFGLRFVILSETHKSVKTWHPHVMAIAVWDEANKGGDFLGYLFIDPYPREGKYGHVGQYGLQPVCLITHSHSSDILPRRLTSFRASPGRTGRGTIPRPASC